MLQCTITQITRRSGDPGTSIADAQCLISKCTTTDVRRLENLLLFTAIKYQTMESRTQPLTSSGNICALSRCHYATSDLHQLRPTGGKRREGRLLRGNGHSNARPARSRLEETAPEKRWGSSWKETDRVRLFLMIRSAWDLISGQIQQQGVQC
jgi:hypothetical protein